VSTSYLISNTTTSQHVGCDGGIYEKDRHCYTMLVTAVKAILVWLMIMTSEAVTLH